MVIASGGILELHLLLSGGPAANEPP